MQSIKFFKRNINRIARAFLLLSVARILCLAFAAAILLGSFMIYASESGRLGYPDSFYLAASAICVTGLTTVSVSELAFSTQVIMMFLIQIGGLGIITFTVLVGILVVRGLSRSTRIASFVFEAIDSHESEDGTEKSSKKAHYVRRILLSIVNISISLELLGAFLLYLSMPKNLSELPGDPNRVFLSLFTAVSAFNNAGFSIVDDITFLAGEPVCLIIIQGLIVMGGIGFPVIIFFEKTLLETFRKIMNRVEVAMETYLMSRALEEGKEPSWIYLLLIRLSFWAEDRLSLYREALHGESNRIQMKVILYGSLILVHVGGLGILFAEWDNPDTIGKFGFMDKLFNSFFLSVSSRTAGFNTFDLSEIRSPTYVLLCSLMFVGGGPQGATGGIKITTFVILLMYLRNVINPQARVTIMGEEVSKNSVAISTRIYFLATIAIVFFMLVITVTNEHRHGIEDIFFEVMSAFGTVGLTKGLTPYITGLEKFFYPCIMYVGRVGVFTLLIAFTGHSGLGSLGSKDDGIKIQVG
ncbi:putative Ktr system potassium uptake protein B [Leptospira fainei serovar Hurstbridge str. BUT 6]|uniref:Ktr system potassium uptake protein B n=1 Tax=Leptospira fainei serovar Hurstbridge str. BUT 6 TaxID=1193011 RepID=S3V0D7_9LEPT|nr:potassium transporter TrkG [Leptospira fainei]EPG74039.1 putative Ktr system potassium uptake protein B [Leptospira fainei serovar Hurstbridge str. BUT 6]